MILLHIIIVLDLKSTETNFLDFDWFYDMLDLDLKNIWTNLQDSDWFYYNQAGMLLEKYKNLLQLFAKQLLMQSNLASSISLPAMCEKPNVVSSKYPRRDIQVQF